jgi:hypothetical protein
VERQVVGAVNGIRCPNAFDKFVRETVGNKAKLISTDESPGYRT